jgi:hypothetical protein
LVPPFLGVTLGFNMRYQINVNTEEMRNVRQSMDHNSPYFYKHFLDSFVPIVMKLIDMSDKANITERLETAK